MRHPRVPCAVARIPGAPGTPGTTVLGAADRVPAPTMFTDWTRKVYVVPLAPAAAQDRCARALPAVATTFVGAVGAPLGVTDAEAADSGPAPRAFSARTWKV